MLNSDVTFAAFKSLPIDPARSRRENGSFVEPADELTGATNCKEAVDFMVEAIRKACVDVGNDEDLVKEEAVVRSAALRFLHHDDWAVLITSVAAWQRLNV